ncbi:MAG: hypothetical protein FWC70_10810 [Defluviitaleaceae bacterium]|nr:hypothetical protein [Defluviitaleaceae bacterium]
MDVKAFMAQERNQQKLPRITNSVEYVTPKEFAKIIKSHYVTVLKWLTAGKIEGAVKFEGRWKIPVRKAE